MIKTPIILCADDYGQNTAISAGICELVTNNRLTAVSCMTTTKNWATAAENLHTQTRIDIGLHFNLTHGKLLTCAGFSHKNLMQKSLFRQLDILIIIKEFEAQIDRFIEFMKKPPDFIDGHQHIQQLPIIRDAFITVYLKKFKTKQPYVRLSTYENLSKAIKRPNFMKQWIIHATGASRFKKLLITHQIPHNIAFAGIYDFNPALDYRKTFQSFLKTVTKPTLIMCHPGHLANQLDDPIFKSRHYEFNYFNSEQFISDLANANIQLCRFQDI